MTSPLSDKLTLGDLPRPSPRGWLGIGLALLLLLFASTLHYLGADTSGRELTIDELHDATQARQVASATFLDEDARIAGRLTKEAGGSRFWVAYPASDSATGVLLQKLTSAGASVAVDGQPGKAAARIVATGLLPLVILAALFGFFFVGGRAGSGEIRSFGTMSRRGGGRALPPDVKFSDVAGADDAVAELREVVEYLGSPGRYAAMGASPPKGVLLFGPPGTGKTLIARATAGEAGVPFFSVAGAEFVESLVGVGAARVRDLFARVREVAPAILFIDELDAAGRRRGGADTGSSDEREQTLNQLLVEMDGFAASAGIVVMAATNRPDILDPALLRPGRFDRHVTVDQPDLDGRAKILALHMRSKPAGPDVDLGQIARRTAGFTGADLANVVNEAALLTVRSGRTALGMRELVEAIERVLGGTQRSGLLLSREVRERVAAHEAGHAIVATALGQEVHRISVVARGRGLGTALLAADEDRVLRTGSDLFGELMTLLAGRAAEELLHHGASTGGEQDLQAATRTAHEIVTRYGLSASVGRVRLLGAGSNEFLGGEAGAMAVSEELRRQVEVETARLLDSAFDAATTILREQRDVLDELVMQLVDDEVVEGPALDKFLSRGFVAATPGGTPSLL